MQNDNARERDVERRLARLESPEPPADLLDRIRGDIPDHLRPVDQPAPVKPPFLRRYRLLAASLALAVIGGSLAWRVFRDTASTVEVVVDGLSGETTIERVPVTELELGAPMIDRDDAEGRVAVPAPAPPQRIEDPLAAEAMARLREIGPPAEDATAYEVPKPATAELPSPAAPEIQEVPPPSAPESRESSTNRPAVTGQAAQQPTQQEGIRFVGGTRQPRGTPVDLEDEELVGKIRARLMEEKRKRREIGVPPQPVPGPSTGGTAEPNDQPWGDMFFRPYGTNPFVDTEDDPQSTFALDVDTGSYTLARSYLERWHLPPAGAIRVEEFLNYFDYRDPAPGRGDFTITAEGAASPWRRGPRYQLLRVGLRGRDVAAHARRDATLIFVVDVSGSMERENRIALVKRSLHLLLDQLRRGDRVGLVVYGSSGQVLLEPSGDFGAVRRAIERIRTGGSTNAEEGLLLGYELARRYYRPESINRLVLCSDGVANVGRTGPESILERIGREADEGIELTTVGFGMGNYNDVLMEQLADQGDGNYAYVDTLEEARRVFVEKLTGTLQTIAADAKIQVEFDPRAVTRYRLLGYENRDVADHRFRDDTVDAGEIGAGHRVTALYEIKLAEGVSRRQPLAEIRLRYRSKQTGRVVEDSLEVRRSQLERDWRGASPSLRLAALAAELAEVLKRSYWARETRPEELRERSRAVERDFRGDRDVAELVRLTQTAVDLVDWPEAPAE